MILTELSNRELIFSRVFVSRYADSLPRPSSTSFPLSPSFSSSFCSCCSSSSTSSSPLVSLFLTPWPQPPRGLQNRHIHASSSSSSSFSQLTSDDANPGTIQGPASRTPISPLIYRSVASATFPRLDSPFRSQPSSSPPTPKSPASLLLFPLAEKGFWCRGFVRRSIHKTGSRGFPLACSALSVPVARCRTSSILHGRLGAEDSSFPVRPRARRPPSLRLYFTASPSCVCVCVCVYFWLEKGLYLGAWHVNVNFAEGKSISPPHLNPRAEHQVHKRRRYIEACLRPESGQYAPIWNWPSLRLLCGWEDLRRSTSFRFPRRGLPRTSTRSKPVHATGLCINGIGDSTVPASSIVLSRERLHLNGAPGRHLLQPGVVEIRCAWGGCSSFNSIQLHDHSSLTLPLSLSLSLSLPHRVLPSDLRAGLTLIAAPGAGRETTVDLRRLRRAIRRKPLARPSGRRSGRQCWQRW